MAEQRTLILGGARSGKSIAAERLLAAEPDVLYVATGGDGSVRPGVGRADRQASRAPAGHLGAGGDDRPGPAARRPPDRRC